MTAKPSSTRITFSTPFRARAGIIQGCEGAAPYGAGFVGSVDHARHLHINAEGGAAVDLAGDVQAI